MKALNTIKTVAGIACVTLAVAAHAQVTVTKGGDTAGTPAPHQTTSEKLSNAELTTKVKTSLAAQSNLKSLHIHVHSRNGVVNLTGSVPDATQRSLAGETTANVGGVKSVRNNLKVVAQ